MDIFKVYHKRQVSNVLRRLLSLLKEVRVEDMVSSFPYQRIKRFTSDSNQGQLTVRTCKEQRENTTEHLDTLCCYF